MRWRLIVEPARCGAANMAVDQALFEGVQAGGRPVLRLYRWSPACLSLGRNQPAAGIIDAGLAESRAIDIVRRPTGGLAVYHDRELTYAVAARAGLLGRPRTAYAAINRALAGGLRRLGAPAVVADAAGRAATGAARAEATGLAGHPCFQEVAEGEVVADGLKLVGSAMRRERETLLQHGSVLLDGDQSVVARLQGAGAGASGSIGLGQILGRVPDWPVLCAAITAGFEEVLGIDFDEVGLSPAESERAAVLEQTYRSDEWTWRR